MNTMKAYVLKKIGEISLCEVPIPQINEDEVLVKVKAAGICGSDIPRIFSTGAHIHPIIPGHEFAGEVADSSDKKLIGKRVGIFPLIPCMQCECCKNKSYEMCRNYSYLGSRRDGGFAEYVAVPKWNLIELPDSVSYKSAAMLEPIAVAAHAIRRALQEKEYNRESVAIVSGMGTIGLLAAYILKIEGFEKVFAFGNKDIQRTQAEKIGIFGDSFINVNKPDLNKVIFDNLMKNGADFVFECVGNNASSSLAVSLAAPGGVVMFVGNPHSDMTFPRDVYWKILRNELKVLGTWNSSFTKEKDDDWDYAIKLIAKGEFMLQKLITHEYALSDLMDGIDIMKDKSEPYIKVMGVF